MALAVVLARFRVHRQRTKVQIAEEVEQRQALEERTRIARELHDVVAHHMSVIAVQASTAQDRIDSGLTAEIAEEFQSIGTSAQKSLQELRQVLGVLRGSEIAARPDLNDLPKLIESTRLAGVPARMIMNGAVAAPSADMQYTTYRIIQEALSNVIKHAPGAKTTVTVEIRPHDLVIDVINKPSPVRRGPPNTPGHGLTGCASGPKRLAAACWPAPSTAAASNSEQSCQLARTDFLGRRRCVWQSRPDRAERLFLHGPNVPGPIPNGSESV